MLWCIPLKGAWPQYTINMTGVPVVEKSSGLLVAVFERRRSAPYTLECAREAVALHNKPIKDANDARPKKSRGRYAPGGDAD